MFKKLIVVLFGLFIGINASAADKKPEGNLINYYIDEQFSGPEKESIRLSFYGWQKQSGGAVRFKELDQVETAANGGIMVWRSTSHHKMVKEINKEIGCTNCLLGVTFWGRASYKPLEVSMVYLVADRLSNPDIFLSVSKHELGHALGIDHTADFYGLMYSGYIDGITPQCMIKSDLEALCGVQNCTGFKLSPCKP